MDCRGGINVYAYVKNNPTRYTDPFGLVKKDNADEDYPWFWYLRCFFDPNCLFDVPAEFLPIIAGQVGGEAANPGSLKKLSRAEADKIAQQNGYRNAEDMKVAVTDRKTSGEYNISRDTSYWAVCSYPSKTREPSKYSDRRVR